MPGYYGDPTNGGQCTGESFYWKENYQNDILCNVNLMFLMEREVNFSLKVKGLFYRTDELIS